MTVCETMKVAFRVDSSFLIGSGHLIRCLSLAKEFSRSGADVIFIGRDLPGNMLKIVQENNFPVRLLDSSASNNSDSAVNVEGYSEWLGVPLDKEINDMRSVLKDVGPLDLLVVDHYSLAHQWERAMKPYANKILVIDDIANRTHECDFLLDQNYYSNFKARYSNLVNADCIQLLGPKYALLGLDFRVERAKTLPCSKIVRRIFVFMGSADADNMTTLALNALVDTGFQGQIDVLIGSMNQHRLEIRRLTDKHDNIRLTSHFSSVAPLMSKADMAIGAGGSTTWERCCLGLPSIVVSIAENQKQICKDGSDDGLFFYAGCSKKLIKKDLIKACQKMLTGFEWRKRMAEKGRELVKANGCEKVWKSIKI